MTIVSTQQKVIEVVAHMAGITVESVKGDSNLVSDLGMDSLDTIEIVMALEEEFEIEITDLETENTTTVAGLVALVDAKRNQGAPQHAAR